ncbi:glutamate-rich protein 1 isoform X2 [Micropterus salmoides]|uniref:glutamate-rich protein 1 isoform X2 n=1 Tax=Micropterus salmoides TaxID=27706 RepID=UPI0018EA9E40|nr:glutamate-rich protein 1 isoform X2 [Micropterus salmoides]
MLRYRCPIQTFQSKVLQRLYPAAPKLEKESSQPGMVEALANKICVKRQASKVDTATGDAGKTQSAASPGRRMYTVLPPPADYKTDSEKSITLPQLERINSAEDPAEESVHDGNEALDRDEEEEEEKRKRRRKRKRKPTLHYDYGKDVAAPVSEPSTGQTPVDEGGERISRNKKRKLKKKRHKEKLLSMGLMPRATALEFTYQKDGDEEEDDERRAAEVSDFLSTTMEIYMSDSLLRADKLPVLSQTVDDLLSSIASGRKPPSVLKQLYSLKAFVQQKQIDKLEKALKELYKTSMSAEETTAVTSLFQYWITDILPMQGDKKTGLSTMHP